MTGYVKIYKPELKIREYELYRGLYCSLCKALSKNFGIFSRLILSYDITFLVLVLLASRGKIPDFKKGVCPFNPSKRCLYCNNCDDELTYGAAVSVILFYFKVIDNIHDGSFLKRAVMRFLLPYAKYLFKKVCKLYPKISLEISVLMKEQDEIEKSGSSDVDLCADASARALGLIFDTEGNNQLLYRFGYDIGRWVYLTDAVDDLSDDIKYGSFNVYINKYKLKKAEDCSEDMKKAIKKSLDITLYRAFEQCKALDDSVLKPIIENIICDGTDAVMKEIFNKSKNKL